MIHVPLGPRNVVWWLVVATVCMLAVLHALPAAAQDASDEILMSRPDAAMCAAALTEAPLLRAQVATLEADLAVKDRALDSYAKLQQLDEQIISKEQRLRQLAEGERDVFKGQVDRAESKTRWLKCAAGGAGGALFGSSVMPGIGTGVGALVGCVAGLFAP